MLPTSTNYQLTMNGEPLPVHHTEKGDFAIACFTGTADFAITIAKPSSDTIIRPLRTNYQWAQTGNTITISLTDQDRVSVEPYGLENPLFILCAPYIPQPANATHVYKSGTVTTIDQLVLKSNDCVYIEAGAVVIGGIFADGADNITITGNGIMWGLPLQHKSYRAVLLKNCNNVNISGITIADSPSWNVVPTACKNVTIHGVNILGVIISTDAFDIVGCEDVTLSHLFACVNDDCVAIKACHYNGSEGAKNVRNVRVSDCVFWKLACGNALEIGFETSANEIHDIVFENIDIIHCQREGWQSGAVFSIHNGDRAHVHHVTFKDIYIEDAQEKLIDIKILTSKYSADKHRGHVSNINFDGIYVSGDVLPPSIIRGYEPDLEGDNHLIEDITVKNLFLNDQQIKGQQYAHAVVELGRNVQFV